MSEPRRRLALIQPAPVLGDIDANLDMHLDASRRAAGEGAHLCVFPELSLTGYFLKDLVPDVAMTLDDRRLEPLLKQSESIDMVVGAVVTSEDFRFHNAALYLSRGRIAHVHRKVYLPTYGMFDEQRYFAAGDRVRAFDASGVAAGMLVCEDLWHLSTAYLLFVQGASLLVCISSSPGRGVLADSAATDIPGSAASWQSLCATVAEYTVTYVAYCNRRGYEDGVNFGGGSSVHGPDGRLLAVGGTDADIVYADIDLREVQRQRMQAPLLRDEKVDFTMAELERVTRERTDPAF